MRIVMNEEEDELTAGERRALGALPSESDVPPGLEDRMVEALQGRGLVARPPTVRTMSVRRWRLAAAAVLFVAGALGGWLARGLGGSGHATSATPASADPVFMLLLYPGPGYTAGGPADEDAKVAEYGEWAGRLAREGRLVHAERLHAAALVLEPGGRESPVADGQPQGFFLVRARSLDEAQSLARACPHLGHGGRVIVQAVNPT